MKLKLKLFLIFIPLFAFSSCKSKTCECTYNTVTFEQNIQDIKRFEKSKAWSKLGLKNLNDLKSETYRLTIIPSSFNSIIYEYLLTNNKGEINLSINEYKRTDNTINAKFKKISSTKNLVLNKTDWINYEKLITEKCFWTMTYANKKRVFDGTSWIIEAKTDKPNSCSKQSYHIVTRTNESQIFSELCNRLLNLAKSSKKEQESLLYKNWISN